MLWVMESCKHWDKHFPNKQDVDWTFPEDRKRFPETGRSTPNNTDQDPALEK